MRATQFHCAVVLTADSLLVLFLYFFPIINVMGFHCYCHSSAAVFGCTWWWSSSAAVVVEWIFSLNKPTECVSFNEEYISPRPTIRRERNKIIIFFSIIFTFDGVILFGYVDVFDSLQVDSLTDLLCSTTDSPIFVPSISFLFNVLCCFVLCRCIRMPEYFIALNYFLKSLYSSLTASSYSHCHCHGHCHCITNEVNFIIQLQCSAEIYSSHSFWVKNMMI